LSNRTQCETKRSRFQCGSSAHKATGMGETKPAEQKLLKKRDQDRGEKPKRKARHVGTKGLFNRRANQKMRLWALGVQERISGGCKIALAQASTEGGKMLSFSKKVVSPRDMMRENKRRKKEESCNGRRDKGNRTSERGRSPKGGLLEGTPQRKPSHRKKKKMGKGKGAVSSSRGDKGRNIGKSAGAKKPRAGVSFWRNKVFHKASRSRGRGCMRHACTRPGGHAERGAKC